MKNKRLSMLYVLIALLVVAAAVWLLLLTKPQQEKDEADQLNSTVAESLVLRYSFDMDESGKSNPTLGEALDMTGNDNPAILNGGLLVSEGRFGGGYELDGMNAYAEMPTAILNGLDELTLSTWVNLQDLRTWQRIFDFGNGTDRYLFLTPMSETGKMKIAIKNGGGEQFIDSAVVFPVDSWTHVAFTWSGDAGILYLNGHEVARNEELSIKPSDLAGTTGNFIGKSQFDVDPYLTGRVDEVRLYNRALSPDEIADQLADGMSDEEIIAFAADWLSIDDSDRVVASLTLPKVGPGGSTISWSSDNTDTVNEEGAVKRPASGAGDQTVNLTAKFSKGKVSGEKSIPLQVWEEGAADYDITIDADGFGAPVSDTLYGIFFEDINFAGDGGVYAELVENRSFEFSNSLWNWTTHITGGGEGTIEVRDKASLNPNNPHYLTMKVNAPAQGDEFAIVNSGFGGLALKQGETYDFSLYARSVSGTVSNLRIYLEGEGGIRLGEASVTGVGTDFNKLSASITASANALNGRLVVSATGVGEIDVDMISLFPQSTWMNRPGGLRADLVQMLADLKPSFIRFPGGSIVGGDGIDNRYNWKDSIGDPAERKQNSNMWGGGALTTPYYQSYGLGFHEYFQLSEDLGAEPLPVVNAGMGDQFRQSDVASTDELDSYINDALDLIEYANGSVATEWGAKRAKNGHVEPFGLQYLAIGNEHWGVNYFTRFEQFQTAIKERYPDIELIASAGPSPAGAIFDDAWRWQQTQPADIVDEHYYMNPNWFLNNSNRYDNYDRNGPRVFVGEYAAHNGNRANNFSSALAEAAYMIGLERNSDVVAMASYAPLFGKEGDSQWSPDLIWFNNSEVYGTPNYYVQQMFGNHVATHVLPAKIGLRNGEFYEAGRGGTQIEKPFYFIAGKDQESGDLILKVVNAAKHDLLVTVQLDGITSALQGTKLSLLGEASAENTFAEPAAVKPAEQAVEGLSNHFELQLSKESIAIYRLKSK